MVGNKAEDGGHKAVAQVGAGHEHTYHSLRVFRTEAPRGGVDDTGIDRGAAETDKGQPDQGSSVAKGQQHGGYAQQDYAEARPGQLSVGEFQGEKAVETPAQGYAHVEEPGKGGGQFCCHAPVEHQIGACPEANGLLRGAVAEEAEEHGFYPGDAGDLPETERLAL